MPFDMVSGRRWRPFDRL